MNDIIVDGKTRVFAIPDTGQSLDSLSAAEVAAGVPLHKWLVPTGLEGFEASTAEVDTTPLGSRTDTKRSGRTSFSGTNLLFKKQEGTDEAFDLLSVRDTDLLIVILDGVDYEEVPVTGEDYEAYPITTGEWNYVGRGEANSVLRVRVPTPISRTRGRGVLAA